MRSKRKLSRRSVLKSVSGGAFVASSLSASTSAKAGNHTGQVSNNEINTQFNPRNRKQAAKFVHGFYDLPAEKQKEIKGELSSEQIDAVVDIQKPAIFVRKNVEVGENNEVSTDKRTTEVNDEIGRKWGWARPEISVSVNTSISTSDVTTALCDAACSCVTSCPDNFSYYRGSSSVSHQVEGITWSGATAFTYEQIASWDAPRCVNGADLNAKGVCNIEVDVRTWTDLAWSYDGEVNRDIDVATDDSEFTSYTKGKFSGPNLAGLGYSANPSIKLRGTQAPAIGEVVSSDNGV